MHTKITLGLLTALLCGSISALPTNNAALVKRDFPNPITPNTQSCSVYNYGGYVIGYSIQIGVPYDNASGCNNVYHALEDNGGVISEWYCQDDGFGDTALYFNDFLGNQGWINQQLGLMYPMVNGFNCPYAG